MNRLDLLSPALLILLVLVSVTGAGEHAELFSRLDGNRDGQLTMAEVDKEQRTLFKRLVRIADDNDDGKLSLAEFEIGLTPSRPEKPFPEKVDNELPGSDALLLMLAWMDQDLDFAITANEVSPELKPLFDEFVDLLNLKNRSRIPVPQLSQQAGQFSARAIRFATRAGIDVEVELALLSDGQWAYVERLRTSPRGRDVMQSPDSANFLFDQLDTDGDGNITADEVPEPYADRFAGLLTRGDRNQDKQLSKQEFNNVLGRLAAFEENRAPLAETTQRTRQLIGRSDTNGDGRLSREEVPRRMAQRFARLDQNGDGQLDEPEVSRAVEILETLRNSAANRPSSTSPAGQSAKNPAQN